MSEENKKLMDIKYNDLTMRDLSDRYDLEFVEEICKKMVIMTAEFDVWLCGMLIKEEMKKMQKESE